MALYLKTQESPEEIGGVIDGLAKELEKINKNFGVLESRTVSEKRIGDYSTSIEVGYKYHPAPRSEIAAVAVAYLALSSVSLPERCANVKPAANTSPAPQLSTTLTSRAGILVNSSPS